MGSRLSLSVAAVTVVFAMAAACQRPHLEGFEGGELRDVGIPFYPRFVATFEPVPFDKPGEYAFSFRGFPSQRAGVLLETPSRPQAETLTAFTTRIELSIRDQAGAVRCIGFGSPAREEPYRMVVWSNNGKAAGLWHSGCSDVDLSDCSPCTLQVKLAGIDSNARGMVVVPALYGPHK